MHRFLHSERKPRGFLANACSYDLAKLLAVSPNPVVMLDRKRDIQITMLDAKHLKLISLTNINQILKTVASEIGA